MSKIKIGLTGTIGSGKGSISNCVKISGNNFHYTSLSDRVREETEKRNLEKTRENLINIGNDLREEFGVSILAKRTNDILKGINSDLILIDGIRNPGEVEELRKSKNFYLIGIDASLDTRFLRIKNRAREKDPNKLEDFKILDYEDRGFGNKELCQQTESCLELCDYLIWNEEPFDDIEKSHLYNSFFDAYNLFKGNDEKRKRPTFEEQFMTEAYTWAKKSTCMRRKVGAVATKNKRLLATGYNGSAKGFEHCENIGCLREIRGIPSGEHLDICRAVHAEENIVAQAAYQGNSIEGSTIYVTNYPCYRCAKLLTNAGVREMIYGKFYPSNLSEIHFYEGMKKGLINIRRFEGVTWRQFHNVF